MLRKRTMVEERLELNTLSLCKLIFLLCIIAKRDMGVGTCFQTNERKEEQNITRNRVGRANKNGVSFEVFSTLAQYICMWSL